MSFIIFYMEKKRKKIWKEKKKNNLDWIHLLILVYKQENIPVQF